MREKLHSSDWMQISQESVYKFLAFFLRQWLRRKSLPCESAATQRSMANLPPLDSHGVLSLLQGPLIQPQCVDSMSTIVWEGWRTGPTCITVMSQCVWADSFPLRLIPNNAPCNLTRTIVLAGVGCGHCGCLITSAVTVQLYETRVGCGFCPR